MITIYGLKNCDTCRKALKWVKVESLEHHFIDVRVEAVKSETIDRWVSIVGWEVLINQQGTTWRKLRNVDRHPLGKDKSIALMSKHPALIKRPVFELNDMVLVGFKEDVRETLKGLKNG